jgi:hypothetical protein
MKLHPKKRSLTLKGFKWQDTSIQAGRKDWQLKESRLDGPLFGL